MSVLLVRWGKEADALEVPEGRTAHEVVSSRFGIPVERLSLVCRGKKSHSTEELLALCAQGAVVMVVGTARRAQLDEPRSAALVALGRVPVVGRPMARSALSLWTFAVRCWGFAVPKVVHYTASAGKLAYLFVASLLPTWRRPERRPHAD
mmetsp:Transcript_982/g.3340  ORF Transcript_982/g.3340 Transcript_982/m.3340 type:complete len:150 (-) Transcript_982:89-538(-)